MLTFQAAGPGDGAYQEAILPGVSRTFALTIPYLPPALCRAVTNGYLLCRIADTIEDCPALSADEKDRFHEAFAGLVSGEGSPEEFAQELAPRVETEVLPAEHDLIVHVPPVIRVTRSLGKAQRAALERCVRIMCDGMRPYQRQKNLGGLEDLAALDTYCYHVAGVVGEMLTDLFCHHSPQVNRFRESLSRRAVSFGQGLQMTNILKDIWEDRARGACWLPRAVFRGRGVDLATLSPRALPDGFGEGLAYLIGIAHAHLRHALEYTLQIPRHETGIRRFCLAALGMAVLTLQKINRRRDFSAGSQVKISRKSVRATVRAVHWATRSNAALRFLFARTARGLPIESLSNKPLERVATASLPLGDPD